MELSKLLMATALFTAFAIGFGVFAADLAGENNVTFTGESIGSTSLTKAQNINTQLSTTLNQSSVSSTDVAGVTLNTFKGVMGLVGIFSVDVPSLMLSIVDDAAKVFNLPTWIIGAISAALIALIITSIFSILLNRNT